MSGDIVERLRAVVDWLLKSRLFGHEVTAVHSAEAVKGAIDALAAQAAEIEQLRRDLSLAVEALEPFGQAAEDIDDSTPDRTEMWEHHASMQVTAADFRRTREALRALKHKE